MLAKLMALFLLGLIRVLTGSQARWYGCPPKAEQRIYFANHQSHADLVMIWAALLAVSCGVARREHVAVTALLHRFPIHIRRWFDVAIDALAFAFFAFLAYFGIGMTEQGATQFATIFDMTMMIPFAAVPVSSTLVCLQLVLMGIRDFTVAGLPAEFAGDE